MSDSDGDFDNSQEFLPPSQLSFGGNNAGQGSSHQTLNTQERPPLDNLSADIIHTASKIRTLSELDNEKILAIWNFLDELEDDGNIDWKKRETKVKTPLPSWRKDEKESPPPRKNRYAIQFEKEIRSGKVKINGIEALNDYNKISKGTQDDTSFNNGPHANNIQPKQNSRQVQDYKRVPVKQFTKSRVKQDKREKNSKFISNRGLQDEINVVPDSELFNNFD
ncbi:unnamed protein product [Orchesella dallaii]|uniref:Uncharacterized protein n=1 Tax=Orchesella dallaii TaxID=48710 RepID=A0ABP1S3P7_9HEXA